MCVKVQMYGDERERYGILEGKSEARVEVAKSMIADKLPLEKVAAYSGLPLSKVRELAG